MIMSYHNVPSVTVTAMPLQDVIPKDSCSHIISYWSCDHLIPHRPFPIGGLLEPSLYL